jgi:hypothetical protein
MMLLELLKFIVDDDYSKGRQVLCMDYQANRATETDI